MMWQRHDDNLDLTLSDYLLCVVRCHGCGQKLNTSFLLFVKVLSGTWHSTAVGIYARTRVHCRHVVLAEYTTQYVTHAACVRVHSCVRPYSSFIFSNFARSRPRRSALCTQPMLCAPAASNGDNQARIPGLALQSLCHTTVLRHPDAQGCGRQFAEQQHHEQTPSQSCSHALRVYISREYGRMRGCKDVGARARHTTMSVNIRIFLVLISILNKTYICGHTGMYHAPCSRIPRVRAIYLLSSWGPFSSATSRSHPSKLVLQRAPGVLCRPVPICHGRQLSDASYQRYLCCTSGS